MNEQIKQAVEYAFDNKISDMQDEINSALLQKVADVISGKRIEVAQNMMSPVSESDEDDFDGEGDDADDNDDEDEDKPKKKSKEKVCKEEYEELLEKLSPEMGAEKYIHDFLHSDNPKFEGKSKKERIQMALGAYYSAKKGKTRNEEVEELEELSSDSLANYRNKAVVDRLQNKDYAKSADDAAFRMKDDRIGDWKSMEKSSEKYKDKINKRTEGIKLASKKLEKIEKDKKKYINARKW